MPRILISASFEEAPLARQTPGSRGCWDEFEFVFAPTDEPIDGWVVIDNLREPLEQTCPPENTLLLTYEPVSIRRYRSRYTSQFAQVWTAQQGIKHRHLTVRNEAQPWLYAQTSSQAHAVALNYDALAALPCPEKPKLLSVICSDKQITPDQRQRVQFTQFLQAELGDAIDVYGRGRRAVEDKADAIWPYQYHIVLENDHSDHYMSEKITDAYLGWSYPIYSGGSEAFHRFPAGSFTAIDIYQPQQALAIIRDCLQNGTFQQSLPEISAARQSVLGRNNLFAMLASYWRENLVDRPVRRTRMLPKAHRTSLVFRQLTRRLRQAA